MRLGIAAPLTALAFDERVCAVEFDEALSARAGEVMQAIDVLREDSAQFAGLLQPGDRMVDGVWLRVAEGVPSFKFIIPMLDPRGFRAHEVGVVNGLAGLPNPLWTAEIRDAAAG